ncbi:hypothetical protein M0804_009682 [Polistes exclamans]|nr:hypothetical protein M0804_009682 [Polistes exclamans]
MSLDFEEALETLWKYFKSDMNVNDTANEFISLGYFDFPDVCLMTVQYWFDKFKLDISYYETGKKLQINHNLRMPFLMSLVKKYPLWTTRHYADALRVDDSTVREYMRHLGYIYSQKTSRWIKANYL